MYISRRAGIFESVSEKVNVQPIEKYAPQRLRKSEEWLSGENVAREAERKNKYSGIETNHPDLCLTSINPAMCQCQHFVANETPLYSSIAVFILRCCNEHRARNVAHRYKALFGDWRWLCAEENACATCWPSSRLRGSRLSSDKS